MLRRINEILFEIMIGITMVSFTACIAVAAFVFIDWVLS